VARATDVRPRATVVTLAGAAHHSSPAGAEQVVTGFLR
jgi:hypothetical protein